MWREGTEKVDIYNSQHLGLLLKLGIYLYKIGTEHSTVPSNVSVVQQLLPLVCIETVLASGFVSTVKSH